MHPIALICLSPLSVPEREASFPRVLESSNSPPEPNPILKSQESQSFWLLVVMPIFALEWGDSSHITLYNSLLHLWIPFSRRSWHLIDRKSIPQSTLLLSIFLTGVHPPCPHSNPPCDKEQRLALSPKGWRQVYSRLICLSAVGERTEVLFSFDQRNSYHCLFFFSEGMVTNPAIWLVLYPVSIFLSLPTGHGNAFVSRLVHPFIRCHFS